jgi:hypothetical protein
MTARSVTSGSEAWDRLRDAVAGELQLRTEIEWLMRLSVETYNPSDRGVRFITGSIGEWMLAFAAYAAGVLTMPDGHNANSHDLRGLLDKAKELWSVKGSNRIGNDFIITNGRNGAGACLTGPVVFWSPELPGMVFADPALHPELLEGQRELKDSTVLSKSVVLAHARRHPECVIECLVPENPGTATKDPGFEAVKILVESGPFRRLRKMLVDVEATENTTVVAQLRELQAMLSAGSLTQSTYEAAVRKVTNG